MIDIRHNLNNNFPNQYGGHIGHSVRPSETRKEVCLSENYKSKIWRFTEYIKIADAGVSKWS